MIEHRYKSDGTKTGQISSTYMGLKRFNPFDLSAKLPREHRITVFDATWNLYHLPAMHVIRTGLERSQLKQACQEMVAAFDTKLLEPDRSKR